MKQLSEGLSKFGPACVGLAGLYMLYKVVTFLRADADLQLLSKQKIPKHGFEDKVVWITGASQGLGKEMAKQFAAKGAYLIVSSRNVERLEAVRRECRGKHAPQEVVVLPLDITAPFEDLQAAASEADAAFGSRGVDVLVHNAGASQRSPSEEVVSRVLDSLFELNVIGTLRLTQAALPLLLARASGDRIRRIVVIGSMAGHMPAAGQALYAACKASLAAYFRSLHSELWARGVRVTMCHPGPIGTGGEGQVRSLYGSSGLITQTEDPAVVKKRQSPQRVAELVLRATYHGLDSCWIAKHPVLLLAYLIQYWPSLGYLLLNKVGPSRVQSYKSGGNGYDVSIFSKSANKAE